MHLGLIAGNGRFPFLVLDAARAQGTMSPSSRPRKRHFRNQRGGQPPRERNPLDLARTARHVDQGSAAGRRHAGGDGGPGEAREDFSSGILPDTTTPFRPRQLGGRIPMALIGAIAAVLMTTGIELIDSTAFITPLLARPGVLTADRRPRRAKDFEFGYRMADAIAALDIGQTIAVKHQAVVAVEAMEGTDEVIGRAGYLAGPGVRIVKVAKPQAGHAVRRAGHRPGDDPGDAGGRRLGAVGGCGQDARARRRGGPRVSRRGRDLHRWTHSQSVTWPRKHENTKKTQLFFFVSSCLRGCIYASADRRGRGRVPWAAITRGFWRRCLARSSWPPSTSTRRAPRRWRPQAGRAR